MIKIEQNVGYITSKIKIKQQDVTNLEQVK